MEQTTEVFSAPFLLPQKSVPGLLTAFRAGCEGERHSSSRSKVYTEASIDRRTFLGAGAALAATLAIAHPATAKEAAEALVRTLPPPQKTGGKPLMDCLNSRRSTHMPGKKELTEQQLANVLWLPAASAAKVASARSPQP